MLTSANEGGGEGVKKHEKHANVICERPLIGPVESQLPQVIYSLGPPISKCYLRACLVENGAACAFFRI